MGSSYTPSKINNQARLVEGEVCFILEASKHGESGRMSKGQPLTPSLGQELLNWSSRGVYTEEGGYMQKQYGQL